MTCLSPCKGCTKRELGCHSTCEDYINWKEEYDQMQDKIRSKRHEDLYWSDTFRKRRKK